MRFRVLGTLELAATSGEPAPLRSRRLRTLLAVLLVSPGEVVSTDRLADVLWGTDGPEHVTAAVHNLVFRLRNALRSAGATDGVELRTRAPGYLLEVGEGGVDAVRFAQLVEDARARIADAPQVAAAFLDEALGLWRGPAYAEFSDRDFARPEAARLQELRLAAIGDRIDVTLALGWHDEAMARLGPVVAEHPLLPRPRAQLMLARHRAGRSAEAVAVYRDYRALLAAELGLDPSTELRTLEAAILRQDPGLDWSPPVSSTGNLPLPLTELIGRADDAARVTDALEHARVVTLTGVGGVGKTRLALHVANELAPGCPDGGWLCELAPVGADAVPDVLAGVLGVQQRAGLTVTQRLAEYLRAKRLLLVVDNCEHVSAAAGRLVAALVRACPQLRVLATSRQPLELDGEQVLPVGPLPVPPQATSNPDDVGEVASVVLFVRRAAAAMPSFRLTAGNTADVAEICRRLDGLPLALELVAPKVRSFSAAEIVARLDRRLQFVRTAGRIREHRHRTLRAVVDWSYELLSEPERWTFDRLSVFAGPFTIDAAERVAGDLSGPEVADVVARLVDRSLLTAQSGHAPTRYGMLETLRHYGRERLDVTGHASATRQAHAAYHVALAEAAARGLTGADPAAGTEAIEQHLDDLRVTHRWAVERDLDLAMRLSAALFWYAESGALSEIAGWAELTATAAEAASEATEPASHPMLLTVLSAAAFGASKRGDLAAATRLARRGLDAVADRHDPIRRHALFVLGDVALFQGRLDDAGECYRDAAHLSAVAGDGFSHTYAVVSGALPLAYGGEQTMALAEARRGASLASDAGSLTITAWAHYAIGEALTDVDPHQAMVEVDTALETAHRCRNRFVEGVALVTAASLRARHGDPYDSCELFGQVIDHWQRAGNWTQQWTTLHNVIDLFVRLGADEPAAVLCGALDASRSAAPLFGTDADRLAAAHAELHARLGETEYRRTRSRGAAMTDDDAVSFALVTLAQLKGQPHQPIG